MRLIRYWSIYDTLRINKSIQDEDGGNLVRAIRARNGTRVPVGKTAVLPPAHKCSAAAAELQSPAILAERDGDAERRRALLNLGPDVGRQSGIARCVVLFLLMDEGCELVGQRLVAARRGDSRVRALLL